ncbi:THUMP-like domain-containing protein [Corynebacterium endometrii]|uniref:THUMP-like domain-containing protein n=1 Tax=Corynebacterium endometrii TaxID=2488819 RepID=A0A4P7QEZ5_9CORY|nr:SAM-dependent methyltransferase [Corynebacterium endometrii]QCB28262.1 hypothetical protein CENDO_04865 [Corynebacterium endometrii]
MAYSVTELDYLSTHAREIDAVISQLGLSKKTQLQDASIAREHCGDYGRAVMELASARATGKVPSQWLADSESVQQATPLAVTEYRASLLARAGVELVHDVTCSIGTEGAALTRKNVTYLGSDLDGVRLRMARYNVPAGHFAQADALGPVSKDGVVVADPARRAGGSRITDPAKLMPPLPDLIDAYRGREMAIKCAPGLDFSHWEGLVSVVSLDGGVKEACVYTPGLAAAAGRLGRREAVIIRGGVLDYLDDSADDLPEAGALGRFIIDPDGAVVRAGLVRHYAAREGLWQIDPHIAYLTGNNIPAGTSGFELIEAVPVKKLKAALASHGAGRVEILVRGIDVDPDQLRKKLKLRGDKPMAVVMTRIGRNGVALICSERKWASAG